MVGDYETNFSHKLLTIRQVPNLRKAFANNLSTNIKLSKTQISKIMQSGGFLGRLLDALLKTELPLMKNVIKPLAKSILIPLGLTATASAADARIHKKISGSGCPLSYASHVNTILIISIDEIKKNIEIVEYLEDCNLLPDGVCKTIQNEGKEQSGLFLSIY